MDHLHKYGKSLKDFNYNNKEIADEIYSAMNSTKFLGISVSTPPRADPGPLSAVFCLGRGGIQFGGRPDSAHANRTGDQREVRRARLLQHAGRQPDVVRQGSVEGW